MKRFFTVFAAVTALSFAFGACKKEEEAQKPEATKAAEGAKKEEAKKPEAPKEEAKPAAAGDEAAKPAGDEAAKPAGDEAADPAAAGDEAKKEEPKKEGAH